MWKRVLGIVLELLIKIWELFIKRILLKFKVRIERDKKRFDYWV